MDVDALIGGYIDEDVDLPDIKDNRIASFAFRYAVEFKKTRGVWASEYGVHKHTIDMWLARKDVREFIFCIRVNQRKKMNVVAQRMKEQPLIKLLELLEKPVDNAQMAEVVRKTAGDCLRIVVKGKLPLDENEERLVSVNVTNNNQVQAVSESNVSVEELKRRVQEIELLEQIVDG
ncbi:MAG: hypothetical protein WC516_06875 [Patescibacteria group bacterium]|jgi:hypothetical protein